MENRRINKHRGIVGRPPSARIHQNLENLFCKNCGFTPTYTMIGQNFIETKWYEFGKYGELCNWIICKECHSPLKMIERR